MRSLLITILCFLPLMLFGQQDNIVRYDNGLVKYVQTYNGTLLIRNTYFSPLGDTVYSWDAKTTEIIEKSQLGEYLAKREFNAVESAHPGYNGMAEKPLMIGKPKPGISAIEWHKMHDAFFFECPKYKRIIKEGDFTVVVDYEDKLPSGDFVKYYQGREVVSGQYRQGRRWGVWKYYSYRYNPYFDVTFFTSFSKDHEREWSILYFELPALISIIIFIIAGRYAARRSAYHQFYYSIIILALSMLLLRLGIPFNRDNVMIRSVIPALWFTSWHTMIVLATVNIFVGRSTKTRTVFNIFFLLAGLLFSLYVLMFKYLDF